jgi:hypothetical protein
MCRELTLSGRAHYAEPMSSRGPYPMTLSTSRFDGATTLSSPRHRSMPSVTRRRGFMVAAYPGQPREQVVSRGNVTDDLLLERGGDRHHSAPRATTVRAHRPAVPSTVPAVVRCYLIGGGRGLPQPTGLVGSGFLVIVAKPPRRLQPHCSARGLGYSTRGQRPSHRTAPRSTRRLGAGVPAVDFAFPPARRRADPG